MPDRASHVRRLRDALALRTAVLQYLAAPRDERAVDALRTATPVAWSVFLRHECCALPIVSRLRADGLLSRFEPAVQESLSVAEASELQRVLAARSIVRDLDAIGEPAGVRFILLKGGALAADPARPPVDLGDVDVLTAPESTERAWNALLVNGWSPHASGLTPTDEVGQRPHFAPLRNSRHQLPLELHARFDYGPSAPDVDLAPETTPLGGYRAIDRLVGVRAIAATLRHSVVVHPHRRGHLRDLFLLAELLRELEPDQLQQLERELQEDAERVELLAMLAQARALSRGEALADPDALRPFVAYKYAVDTGTSRLLATSSPGWNTWSHLPLERASVRRAAYGRLLRGSTEPILLDWSPLGHPVLGARLARVVGLPRLVRVGRRVALVIALIAVGGMIRRHVAALTSTPKGVD